MSVHSFVRTDHIEYGFWLVFDETGGMRASRGQPNVQRGERAMCCRAILPLSLFVTPELRATIEFAEPVQSSFQIDVQAASTALKQAIGCDVDLRVVQPEDDRA